MALTIAVTLKVFLVTAIGISLARGNQKEIRQTVKTDVKPYGNNNVLVYDHFGDTMYFTESEAWNNFTKRTLFEVIQEDVGDENIVSIKGPESYEYFNITPNQQLNFRSEAYRTIFHLSPVEGSIKFHLLAETSPGTIEPIVTPDLDQPFSFFLKSRYPHEPNAEFVFIRLNIELSYNGVRDNILGTLEGIRNGELGDKTKGYSQLISLMHSFGHMEGQVIFKVGIYIKEDLGIESVPFSELPTQVQLIVSGVPVSFSFWRAGIEEYRMKYAKARNSILNILPYTFNYDNSTSARWSITYAEDHQLYAASSLEILERSSEDKSFEFGFTLNADLEAFSIIRASSGSKFATKDTVPPFRFIADINNKPEKFTVEKYISNIVLKI